MRGQPLRIRSTLFLFLAFSGIGCTPLYQGIDPFTESPPDASVASLPPPVEADAAPTPDPAPSDPEDAGPGPVDAAPVDAGAEPVDAGKVLACSQVGIHSVEVISKTASRSRREGEWFGGDCPPGHVGAGCWVLDARSGTGGREAAGCTVMRESRRCRCRVRWWADARTTLRCTISILRRRACDPASAAVFTGD